MVTCQSLPPYTIQLWILEPLSLILLLERGLIVVQSYYHISVLPFLNNNIICLSNISNWYSRLSIRIASVSLQVHYVYGLYSRIACLPRIRIYHDDLALHTLHFLLSFTKFFFLKGMRTLISYLGSTAVVSILSLSVTRNCIDQLISGVVPTTRKREERSLIVCS